MVGRLNQPEIHDHLFERESQSPDRRGAEMSKGAGQTSRNTLRRLVDLLVEHRIKLDALEHVLKETNPLVHKFYLGTIENLRAQKAAEVNQVLKQFRDQ